MYELKVNTWNTSHSFKKGHKIRIHISSAAFPKYSRNLNTGLDLATVSNTKIAETKIIHSKIRPLNVSFFLYKRATRGSGND
jgi:predicted acyl esterase